MQLDEGRIRRDAVYRCKLKKTLLKNKVRLANNPLVMQAIGEIDLARTALNGSTSQQQLLLKRVEAQKQDASLSPRVAMRFT